MSTADTAVAGHETDLSVHDVVVRVVMVPLAIPLATKIGQFAQWPLVLVDVRTEQGLTGRGYVAPYQLRITRALVPLLRDLGTELQGGPASPVRLARAVTGLFGVAGRQGIAAAAVAGLDMALWDLLAKRAGLPLAELLGGTVEPVPAYNSNGLGLLPPDRLADEACALIAQGGFTGLKVRVGRDDPAADLEALRRVRDAVGDDVVLVADYNQGLTLAEAIPRCRSLDGEGLAWIEEPLRYDDLAGHAQLARDTTTPIMLGENFWGPQAMSDALRAGACDLVMPDLMRIGGVTGWLRAAALAEVAGTPMSSHLYPEISGHLMAVTPTGHWLEWQDWAHPVLAEPFVVRGGHLHLPRVPGNGLEWDEAAVAHHLVR